jgi:FKBP-type peptidyl-prolyl cis-trans isomerase
MKPRLLMVALAGALLASILGCDASRETGPFGQHRAGLVIRDLKLGSGTVARAGNTLTVNYRGMVDADPAYQFDSSYDRGQPFVFQLGTGQVIAGWDVGLSGMRVGGQRMLIVPPEWGYGAQGASGVIPPNATLIFTVELLEVR